MIGRDIFIFEKPSLFTPYYVAHEFAHRIGYGKELYAQLIAYYALTSSPEQELKQASYAEQTARQMMVLKGTKQYKPFIKSELARLRKELQKPFHDRLYPKYNIIVKVFAAIVTPIMLMQLKLTRQHLSDYGLGFTNMAYAYEQAGGVNISLKE